MPRGRSAILPRAHAAVLLALLLCTLLACKNKSIKDKSTVTRPGAPSDVELWRPTDALACDDAAAGTPRAEACRIARDFAAAAPVAAWPSSGRAVWYGRTYRVVSGKAENVAPYFFQVEPGKNTSTSLSFDELKFVLPVHGSARDLIPENASERADADAVLAALMSSKPIPESPAVSFMKTAAPENGFRAMADSSSASTILVSKHRIYVRQHGTRLVMVEPHDSGGGWFSELWRLP
ncbi:MAG TPA: hypothetical protein PKA88_35085 [Polyangiaceae bacterium]|nr:hypothetical protein [Polyangiaceae bacterium]